MGASKAVGVEFVKLALGPKASYAMMTFVGLSAYGTLNGTLFACPRLTLAAAREGIFIFIRNGKRRDLWIIMSMKNLSGKPFLETRSTMNV